MTNQTKDATLLNCADCGARLDGLAWTVQKGSTVRVVCHRCHDRAKRKGGK